MSNSTLELSKIATTIGYAIPESEIDDYVILLAKAVAAFEAVEAMDGSSSSWR
jgi:hypothetical protein